MKLDHGAFRTAEFLRNHFTRELDGRAIVDAHDLIASLDTERFTWSANDRRDNRYGVVDDVELNTNTIERSAEVFFDLLHFLRRDVHRMRIELVEHALNCSFGEFLCVDILHVVLHGH